MTPRHLAPSTSSWGSSFGGCGRTALRLAAAGMVLVALFAALLVAACSMAPRDDAPTTTGPNRCGEMHDRPEGCD